MINQINQMYWKINGSNLTIFLEETPRCNIQEISKALHYTEDHVLARYEVSGIISFGSTFVSVE